MLKNPPFAGTFSILQSFGDHPDFYQQFSIDGVAQRGHNGIDYGVPFATPILATADGTVLEVGEDLKGYGHYIVLGHAWGQTLYANLSEVVLEEGASVAGGERVGFSGSSGSATDPQLHFGIRVSPFSVHDGWFGYTDPAPYLLRISQSRGPIIGPHLVGRIDMDLMRTWQPRMLLVLDPNPDEMLTLRRACPNTTIIGRVFATDHEIAGRIRNGPKAAAQWAHDKIMERMNPHVDYWQFANEVLQHVDELPLLNQFEMERMRLADEAGFKCAILAFSVGNPDLPEDDRMGCWEKVYPAIEYAEDNEHVIAVHQYGMPNLLGPDGLTDWLILRLEHQVLMRLPFKKVKFAVTEYGIDGLIQGPSPSGWKHFTNAEEYANQLMHNGQYVERFSGRILGYSVFTVGHFSPWGSYDILGAVARQLAEQSDRGTWSDVTVLFDPLGETTGDTITNPGSGGAAVVTTPAQPEPVQPEPVQPEPVQPEPVPPTETSTLISLPTIERRVSSGITNLNGAIRPISDRPDIDISTLASGDLIYLIRDVFTTTNGSWEPSDIETSITQWARDDYLKPFGASDWFDDAGADHHLFGAVIGLDGELIRNQELISWSDGFDRLGDADYSAYVRSRTKAGSGWSNQPLGPGSSYVPDRGESGPWSLMPSGISEVYVGAGLPANHHVSTFVVWQAVTLADDLTLVPDTDTGITEQPEPVQPEPVEPEDTDNQTPGTEAPVISDSIVSQRFSDWVEPFNMSVRGVDERPDASEALSGEEVVYILKDLFTTRDGSWEPSDKPGSISEWAKEYLKPVGASDYFDDAGGDRHLFAAVIGLDGKLMPNKQIMFWSDGINVLSDQNYSGYVLRDTKDKSGWINIPIGPGSNFVPERGESGPWCWAPTGAADVVCGGGLPAKQHVSTFAVWQAVRREDLLSADTEGGTSGEDLGNNQQENEQGTSNQTTIFMPFISGGYQNQPTRAATPVDDSQAEDNQLDDNQAEAEDAIALADAEHTTERDLVPLVIPSEALTDLVRTGAWIRVGVEYDSDSPLTAYARLHSLGMPTTDKFDVDDLVVQGYSGGIVFATKEDLESIGHMEW